MYRISDRIDECTSRRALKIIFMVYVGIRILWYFLCPMDWSLVYWRWQTLDLSELRGNLFQALVSCHQQPPLWNLFIGLNVKIFPDPWGAVPIQIEYAAMSFYAFWLLVSILRRSIENRIVVLVAMVLYSILPAVLYSESWLTYTFPILFLLLLACKFMLDYVLEGRFRSLVLCSLVMSVIVLSRAFFHVVAWLVPCLLILLAVARRKGHILKSFVTVSLLTITAAIPYFSNFIKYGIFAGSTWQGSNMHHTLHYVTKGEMECLFDKGKISEIAMKSEFPVNMSEWRSLLDDTPRTGIPILDKEDKASVHPSRESYPNMNNRIVPIISRAHGDCWRQAIMAYPSKYLTSVANALFMFFSEELDLYFDKANAWFPQTSDPLSVKIIKIIRYLCVPIVVFLFFLCAVLGCLFSLKKRKTRLFALFCLINLVYVCSVSCLFELGEELIMRVPSEPFWVMGIALFLDHFVQARKRSGKLKI